MGRDVHGRRVLAAGVAGRGIRVSLLTLQDADTGPVHPNRLPGLKGGRWHSHESTAWDILETSIVTVQIRSRKLVGGLFRMRE